ncbi:MAG: T9SS type A sorting domain-containing protein, partial [Bacteroidota bacterium]
GEPIGTYDNQGNVVNPEYDATGDCGEQCYVTDNAVGTYSSNDVDNGYTRLTSPVFDLTNYQNPVITYQRWFVNIAGSSTPNDTLIISLTDGIDTVVLEKVTRISPSQGAWYPSSFTVSNFMTPGASMRLIVRAEDYSPGHVLEAGFDDFRVTGTITTDVFAAEMNGSGLEVFPNPSSDRFYVRLQQSLPASGELEILDMVGRIVKNELVSDVTKGIEVQQALPSGCYTVRFIATSGMVSTARVLVR